VYKYFKTLLIILTICLSTIASAQTIGQVVHDKDAGNNDVARALGMDLYKFNYTVDSAAYDVDVWLEQWDQGSSEPVRLTEGKTSHGNPFTKGDIVFSRADDVTTVEGGRAFWRIGFSWADNAKTTVSSRDQKIIKNPLHGIPGGQMNSSITKSDIKLREDISLVTWSAGAPCMVSNHETNVRVNARTVYLKMKVMPHGELTPE